MVGNGVGVNVGVGVIVGVIVIVGVTNVEVGSGVGDKKGVGVIGGRSGAPVAMILYTNLLTSDTKSTVSPLQTLPLVRQIAGTK